MDHEKENDLLEKLSCVASDLEELKELVVAIFFFFQPNTTILPNGDGGYKITEVDK